MGDDTKRAELKELVREAREGGNRLYPARVRERVRAYARERYQAGLSVKQVAAEIEINPHTLAFWRDRGGRKVRRVEVVESKPVSARYCVHGAQGTRVEDLSLDEVAELLRKLQ